MTKQFVKVCFTVSTQVEGFEPRYRVYVNDELFTERTYYARPLECYEEILQVLAPPGSYTVRLEPLDQQAYTVGPLRVIYGPAAATEKNKFRILGHK